MFDIGAGDKATNPLIVYDLAGNISSIGDGVRQEERAYQYDFLDRLTFAGVYAGQQMIEERYYTYNQLGNLLSFRHRYPSAGQGRGAFAVGDELSSTNNTTRGNFNGLSSTGMSSTNHSGSAVMPYVYGFGGEGSQGGYNTRGSLASGIQGEGSNYQGAGSFNPMTGASESAGYDSRGVTSFVRGIEGGFGGWEGNEYTGPTGETTIDYTYPDNGVRPHAVTARSNGDIFSYDANGNMTSRTQDGVTWTQVFDEENRLVSVSNGTTTTTTYVYDGSGGRLKRIVNEGGTITTTLYVAGMEIETVGGTETKRTVYYPSGGAFRVIGGEKAGLYYRHSDHLGSTSVLSDANGMKVSGSDVVYAPFGEVRSGEQSALTDFGYTGQRKDDSTGGLMYYGARYYLPGIQHFVSADTIVPGAANPQAFNRYSYVVNNPIRLVDPSGHIFCEGTSECGPHRGGRGGGGGTGGSGGKKDSGDGKVPDDGKDNHKPGQPPEDVELPPSVEDEMYGVTEHPYFIFPWQAESPVWSTANIDLTHGRKSGQTFFGDVLRGIGTGLDMTSLFFDVIMLGDTVGDIVSWSSTGAWMLEDIIYGRTRIDVYSNHSTLVLGNNTTTSLVTSALGQSTILAGPLSPVADFGIDLYLVAGDATVLDQLGLSLNSVEQIQGMQWNCVTNQRDLLYGAYPPYVQFGDQESGPGYEGMPPYLEELFPDTAW